MPTQPYFVRDGSRVPGTTTVIGKRKEADGLIYWAWDLGRQGIDYRQARDKAADIGTVAHELCEMFVREQPFDYTKYDPKLIPPAEKAFDAFRRWLTQSRLMVVAVEIPLVSEKYRFGGTIDMVISDGTSIHLGDLKSSNRTHYEHLIQVCGGYNILWNENFPDMPIVGHHILRLGKEFPDFAHHYFEDIPTARKMFVNMREQYDMIGELKKRAA